MHFSVGSRDCKASHRTFQTAVLVYFSTAGFYKEIAAKGVESIFLP